jgi:serine phosphatase RsbU (regulator of sigma subunit)/anti-sigma regulatory factor (Ser/Thr protein kinase)
MNDSMSVERGAFTRVKFRCDLAEAREATRGVRSFLAGHGLDESEQFSCELCLTEASNNAVQYATCDGAAFPIVIEVLVLPASVELRVTDRTAGFELQEKPARLNPDRENGRGVFIIQSLMDQVHYQRGTGTNTLVMRKTRTHHQHRPADDAATATLEDARCQLENCQRTISGMARELCFRSESLSAIFRCCTELGRTSDLEGFAKRLLTDLLHLTAADWYVLRLLATGEPQLSVFTASSPEIGGAPLPIAPAAHADSPVELTAARTRSEVEFDARRTLPVHEPLRAAGANATGIVQPLLFGDKLLGTLAIGRREAGEPFTALQAEMIRAFSEFMAVQLMNIRHREEQVHARLVAHELEIAHRIQRALLPRTLPQLCNFRLAGTWESARQVGGDFYDAFALDDHSMLLVVGDVMGKGVPAAIFATITRSLLRALAVRIRHPGKLLKRLNELLHAELSSVGMFITAQLVFADLKRRQLVTASAGHCPVLLLSGDTVRTLGVTGTPLGILPNATYRQQTAAFGHPGGLLIYTDGLTEAMNPAGEMFGEKRLADWLRARLPLPGTAATMRDELAAELIRFRGTAPLRDDQAFLLLAEDPAPDSSPQPEAGAGGESTLKRSTVSHELAGPVGAASTIR